MCSSRNEHAPLKLDQLSTFSFLKSQFCRRFFLFTFRPRRLIIISRFVTLSRFSLHVDDSGGRVSSKFRHKIQEEEEKETRRDIGTRTRKISHPCTKRMVILWKEQWFGNMPVSIIMLAILSRTSSTMSYRERSRLNTHFQYSAYRYLTLYFSLENKGTKMAWVA